MEVPISKICDLDKHDWEEFCDEQEGYRVCRICGDIDLDYICADSTGDIILNGEAAKKFLIIMKSDEK